jgi:hypothetical protein
MKMDENGVSGNPRLKAFVCVPAVVRFAPIRREEPQGAGKPAPPRKRDPADCGAPRGFSRWARLTRRA